MELYAAGFNAWNQLLFRNGEHDAEVPLEPTDVTSFTRILSGETIGQPVSQLSATLGMQGPRVNDPR